MFMNFAAIAGSKKVTLYPPRKGGSNFSMRGVALGNPYRISVIFRFSTQRSSPVEAIFS
jgi:hypothetical protein